MNSKVSNISLGEWPFLHWMEVLVSDWLIDCNDDHNHIKFITNSDTWNKHLGCTAIIFGREEI